MKKTVYIILALILMAPACKKKQQAQDYDFTFAFLTDIHIQPEMGATEGFRKAIDTLNLLNPDFIITGGDMVMDALNTRYSRVDSLYTLYSELCEGFNMPVYNTIGNHEIYGWHSDEEGIEDHPEFGKKMFEDRIGERFYSFDHQGWHFIVLDAIAMGEEGRYIGRIGDEQIAWLERDLQKTGKETPIVTSVHIPFITARTQLVRGSLEANSKGSVITNSRDVLLKLEDYNLKLVLQGHLHFLEDIYVGNRTHFITGGAVSGRWWRNEPGSEPQEGFLLVRVKDGQIEWEYIDYGWTTPLE